MTHLPPRENKKACSAAILPGPWGPAAPPGQGRELPPPASRPGLARLLGALAGLIVWGCGGGGGGGGAPGAVDGAPQGPPPSVERRILATATDSRITATPPEAEAPHVALNPSPAVPARGALLVFLPGTQGRPTLSTFLLRAAAARGLHAVGLNYPNGVTMSNLCQTSGDPDCYWAARREVVFGGGAPVEGQAAVTREDSIVHRLSRLLGWLDAQAPQEGWGRFLLADGTTDWSQVVLAGHSQGGGHVGVLAKTVSLRRAIYFSSPSDWDALTDQPDGWSAGRPNVTPASRQFAFGSDLDALVPIARASAHWDAMGLARPIDGPALVEGASPPFSGSHQLRTVSPPNPTRADHPLVLRQHGLTVVDDWTPVDDQGRPLFDVNGVWEYLFTPQP